MSERKYGGKEGFVIKLRKEMLTEQNNVKLLLKRGKKKSTDNFDIDDYKLRQETSFKKGYHLKDKEHLMYNQQLKNQDNILRLILWLSDLYILVIQAHSTVTVSILFVDY